MTSIKHTTVAFQRAVTRMFSEGGHIRKREAGKIVQGGMTDIAVSSTPAETFHEARRFIQNSILESDRCGYSNYLPHNTKGFKPHSSYEILSASAAPLRKAAMQRVAKLAGVRVKANTVELARTIAVKGLQEIQRSEAPAKELERFRTLLNEAINLRSGLSENRLLGDIRVDFFTRAERLLGP